MRKVLITGGTGFFGKSMLDWRLRHQVCALGEWTLLSRNPEIFIHRYPALSGQPGVRFIAGDVRKSDFGNERFDVILHAATPASRDVPDDEMSSVIVDGARHVIDYARTNGVPRVLFTSSGAVYGHACKPSAELDALVPVTAYGCGKLQAEKMLLDSGLDVQIARCFAFVGPYLNRDIHFAIGNFIRDALLGEDIVIKGDGSPLRSYMYADDLVEWLFCILERGESGGIYNVGSDAAIPIRDLAMLVRNVLESSSEIRILGETVPGVANYYVPNIDRARRELGLQIRYGLEEAIRLSVTQRKGMCAI